MYKWVAFQCILIYTCAYVIESIQKPSYNYRPQRVFNLTSSRDDVTLQFNSTFPIYFQGRAYTSLYVCSNSFLTFQDTDPKYNRILFIPLPKILISAQDYVMSSLEVWWTADNLTVFYNGYEFNKTVGKLTWTLTFHRVDGFSKFDLSVVKKSGSSGVSGVCSALACYKSFDMNVGTMRFVDCGADACYSHGACVKTTGISYMANCEVCSNGLGDCQLCEYGYEDVGCSTCTANFRPVQNRCIQTNSRCQQINTSSPAQCLACKDNLNGFYCDSCAPGYFFLSEYTCALCPFKDCKNCTLTVCYECFEGFGLDLNNDCKSRSSSNSDSNLTHVIWSVCAGVGAVLGLAGLIMFGYFCYKRNLMRMQVTAGVVDIMHPNEQVDVMAENDSAIALGDFNDDEMEKNREEMCSICLECDSNVMTNCLHYFHRKCLCLWFLKDKSCPNCKFVTCVFFKGCTKCKRFLVQTELKALSSVQICGDCKLQKGE